MNILLRNPRVLYREFVVERKSILNAIKEDKVKLKAESNLVNMLDDLVDKKFIASDLVKKLQNFKPELKKGIAKNTLASRESILSNGEKVGSFF